MAVKKSGLGRGLDALFPEKTVSSKSEKNVKGYLHQTIYKTIIPRNVRLAEAPSHGLPINLYDTRSAGAESYRLLAQEVLHKGEEEWQ